MKHLAETGTPRPEDPTVLTIGFFLTPQFGPLGFFAALEVLRTANRFLDTAYYGWRTYSIDGEPAVAANGIPVTVEGSISDDPKVDFLFVCAGYHPENH